MIRTDERKLTRQDNILFGSCTTWYIDSFPNNLKLQSSLRLFLVSFNRSSYKTLEFTTSICLKLLEICVKKLNFRDQLEIVCLLIRLLLTSIQRQRKGMAESSSEVENKTEEGAVINKLLKILRNELMCVLPPSMNYHYRSDSLLRELQVNTKYWLVVSCTKMGMFQKTLF